jgi:hypothetical protein
MKESGQTIAMYYWGLAKLGVPGSDLVYEQLDEIVEEYFDQFTL